MGKNTGIGWCDFYGPGTGATWNPFAAFNKETQERGWACNKIGPGCRLCYAETMNVEKPFGMGTALPYIPDSFKKVDIKLVNLDEPIRWKKPRGIFICSMTDLFLEHYDKYLDTIFTVVQLSPQHTFITMTKRFNRWFNYMFSTREEDLVIPGYLQASAIQAALMRPVDPFPFLSHVIYGLTINTQAEAETAFPLVRRVKQRWPSIRIAISNEPALEPINWVGWQSFVDWMIVGGESGAADKKPVVANERYVRYTKNWCQEHNIAFFFKQWGGHPNPDKHPRLDGAIYEEFPGQKPHGS